MADPGGAFSVCVPEFRLRGLPARAALRDVAVRVAAQGLDTADSAVQLTTTRTTSQNNVAQSSER